MDMEKLELQSKEFDALDDLTKKFQLLPSVVDDDYPEHRHNYESSLKSFIEAIKNNGRI